MAIFTHCKLYYFILLLIIIYYHSLFYTPIFLFTKVAQYYSCCNLFIIPIILFTTYLCHCSLLFIFAIYSIYRSKLFPLMFIYIIAHDHSYLFYSSYQVNLFNVSLCYSYYYDIVFILVHCLSCQFL